MKQALLKLFFSRPVTPRLLLLMLPQLHAERQVLVGVDLPVDRQTVSQRPGFWMDGREGPEIGVTRREGTCSNVAGAD